MFAIPANGGYRVKPDLLKNDQDSKQWRQSLNLKPDTVKTIREGLRQVVAGGTGAVMNVPDVPPQPLVRVARQKPPR